MSKLWKIDWNSDTRGLIIGLVVEDLNPQQNPPISQMVGEATVSLDPAPENKDFQMVYLDTQNITNTTRTSTDKNQSLFFLINVEPGKYTLSTKHQTYQFNDVDLPVEAGKITYVLLTRLPGD